MEREEIDTTGGGDDGEAEGRKRMSVGARKYPHRGAREADGNGDDAWEDKMR